MTAKRNPKPAHPAIVAIRAEAARVGWPTHFATGLAHDERAISGFLPREPFLWCLRADGTHIARAPEPKSGSSARVKPLTMKMVAETFREGCRFYIWDGVGLGFMSGGMSEQTTAADADERLAKLAAERYQVMPRRPGNSFVPAYFATQREANECAIAWEQRYGEDMRVIDLWSEP